VKFKHQIFILGIYFFGLLTFPSASSAVTVTFVEKPDETLTTAINGSGDQPGASIIIKKLDKGDFKYIFPFGKYTLFDPDGKKSDSFTWSGAFKGPYTAAGQTKYKLIIDDFYSDPSRDESDAETETFTGPNQITFESSQSDGYNIPTDLTIEIISPSERRGVPEPSEKLGAVTALIFLVFCYVKKKGRW
jgi:hypothetical protein